MKILVIDDDDAKSTAILAALEKSLGDVYPQSTSLVKSLAEAVRVLSLVTFDLVVLDLMLPYVSGGLADSRAGLELVRQMRSEDGPNRTAAIIGISAFPDEVAASRARFDELGVLIIGFDDEGSWSRALLRILEDANARATSKIEVDFVVICALEEERKGFTNTSFERISEAIVSGLNVHYVRLPGPPRLLGAIVRLSQMGLVAATFETALALSVFRTKILSMSGICAGFSKNIALGQLVVASPCWEYQAGKWSANGFEIAPMQVPLLPSTRAVIDQTIDREEFVRNLEDGLGSGHVRPPRQVKPALVPFVSGSAVIADATKLAHIQKQHRKVAALDMETFGLYFAASERSASVEHFFSIKCVVDFADSGKSDDLQSYGCVVSARAAEQLLRALLRTGEAGRRC